MVSSAVLVDATPTDFYWDRRYAVLDRVEAGQTVSVEYPLRRIRETVNIAGGKYEVDRKGDTVINISPEDQIYPLYRRSAFESNESPMRTIDLHVPSGEIHW